MYTLCFYLAVVNKTIRHCHLVGTTVADNFNRRHLHLRFGLFKNGAFVFVEKLSSARNVRCIYKKYTLNSFTMDPDQSSQTAASGAV